MTWKKNKGAPAGQQPRADDAAAAESGLSKYKKYLKWIIPLVVVVLLVVVIALRNASTAKTAEVAPEYTQASVTRRTISQTLSTTGTLNAANSYTVKTLVQGEILSSDFEEGDQVSSGQQLYQIENSDASTNVEQAQINLEQAQRNYDQIADYRYVRSPVAGTVYTLSVKVGDEVTSGQEVAVVQDASQMVLQLTFPSADAAHFAVGQSAQITLDGTFEVLQGTVTEVSGSDVLSTGNVLVRNVTISTANNGALNTAQSATATINGISSTNSATFNYREQRTPDRFHGGHGGQDLHQRGAARCPRTASCWNCRATTWRRPSRAPMRACAAARSRCATPRDTLANYTITAPINGTVIQKNRPGRRVGGERQRPCASSTT